MKLFFTTLTFSLLVSFLGHSQIVKSIPNIPFYVSGESTKLFITKDRHFIVAQQFSITVFDEAGNLLYQGKLKKSSENLYMQINRADYFDEENDIFYTIYSGNGNSRSNKGEITIRKVNSSTGDLVKESIDFEENLNPSRNMASEIWNDYSSYSSKTTMDSSGILYNFDLYMAKSQQTHPTKMDTEDDIFHTFVHIVRYNPETNKIDISNALVDKMDIEKKYQNSAFGDVVGVIGTKLIVKYTSYRSEEMKGLYDALGDAQNYQIDYWSYDLINHQENKLLSYTTNFPPETVSKKLVDIIVGDQIYCDLTYTVKASAKDKYLARHKVLNLNLNGDTTWTNYDIPESMFTLYTTSPASFDIHIGKDDNILMGNSLYLQLEDDKKIKCYFLYSKNEKDEVDLTVYVQEPTINENNEVELFKYKQLTEEDIKSIFGRVRDSNSNLTKGRTESSSSVTALRVFDNELILFGCEYFNITDKQKKKNPDVIRIETFDIAD